MALGGGTWQTQNKVLPGYYVNFSSVPRASATLSDRGYYEQGAKDLNGAKLATLLKLCLALDCKLGDILTDEETVKLLEHYTAA